MNFQVGDKVICIQCHSNIYHTFNLTENKIYTVVRVLDGRIALQEKSGLNYLATRFIHTNSSSNICLKVKQMEQRFQSRVKDV